jgi:hypothetical protein
MYLKRIINLREAPPCSGELHISYNAEKLFCHRNPMNDIEKDSSLQNIIDLDDIRARKKSGIIPLLRDTQAAAQSIAAHICLICKTKKMCVNKTGVCTSCYDTVLTVEEKKVADEEAKHKTIRIVVTDDRWEK